MRRRGTEHKTAAGWQKVTACVNDDIRPPTIQLSRSGHIHSIQRACLPSDTCSFSLVFVRSPSLCQTPRLASFHIKACSIPQCSDVEYKSPGSRWSSPQMKTHKLCRSHDCLLFLGYIFSTAKQKPGLYCCQSKGGDESSLASHNNLSQLGETEQEGKVGNF